MKKTLFALIMSVIMIGFASCGSKHSEAFNKSKKILEDAVAAVEKADNCDDLDAAVFTGVFGLLAVEGIDQMPESEAAELETYTEKLDKAYEDKKAKLDCQDDEYDFDDDMPMDELFELEDELED